MKNRIWMRIFSMLLSIVLCIQLCTTIVLAEDENEDEAPSSQTQTEDATLSREPVGELKNKRTENEKYFLCEDNSVLAVVYPQAVHFENASGEWQDIDNTLIESTANGQAEYENTAGAWNIKFAKKAKDGKLARLKYGKHKISWYLSGAKKTKGTPLTPETSDDITVLTKTSSGIRYKSILPEVSLEYALIGNHFKENLILDSPDAPDCFTFVYETGDLEMHLSGNSVYFCNNDETVFVLDAPVMTDAALEESFNITLSLKTLKDQQNNHIYALTLTPDVAWLSEENRLFPVVVDPIITTEQSGSGVVDTYTSSNEPTTAFYDATTTKVGINSDKVYRGYLKFDLPTQVGASDRVVGAVLQLTPYLTSGAEADYNTMATKAPVIEAHALTSAWDKTTLSWNNAPSYDSMVLDYDIIAPEGNLGAFRQYTWDITDLVDNWYTTGGNYGVMLKYDNETSYGSNMVANFVSSNVTDTQNGYYPVISIWYMNMQGLENYWTYHTLDAGVAGTAYINDFTGALTCITPLVSIASERAPINISLVYSPGSNDSSVNALNVGNGFMLNVQSYIKKVTVGSQTKYKYVDGDGTAHYFENRDGKWVDESGLGYTLNLSGEYWKITDKQDNTLEFYPDQGRLLRSTDNNGNVVRLHYEAVADGNTTKYYLIKVTNAAVDGTHDVIFSRNGTRLERITYPSEYGESRYAQITYTDAKNNIYHLTQYAKNGNTYLPTDIVSFVNSHNVLSGIISCPYDKTNTPTGSETQLLKGTALRFTYNFDAETDTLRRRVVTYKKQAYEGMGEYSTTEYAASVSYGNGSTKYTSTLGETRTELYTFNRFGHTITAQDTEGHALFQSQGISGGSENKVTFTSASQHAVINIVKNHNFEKSGSGTPDWYFAGATNDAHAIKGTAHGEPTHIGALGMKVYKYTSSSTTDTTAKQTVTLSGGKVYTLSAYVKTAFTTVANVAHAGACIGVERLSAPVGQFYTNSIISAGGYTRHFVVIDLSNVATGTYNYDILLGIKRAAGVAYFDCIQLEEGSVANSYNLLENAGFEQVPSNGWTQINADNMDGRVQEKAYHCSGTYGYKMKGSPKVSRMLTQTILVNGKAGDSYTAGVWIKTATLPCKDDGDGTQQNCAITLEFCGANGSSQYFTEMLDSCNTEWRYICVGGVASRTYSSIKVHLKYAFNANVTYFDDANLFADTFGQSYTYDARGNITSVVDLANTTSSTAVNGNNDVTSYTDGKGNVYKFTYNEDATKHQLHSATDPKNMVTTYSYNSYGNVTQVDTLSSGGMKMQSSLTYTPDGHYLKTETDSNGAVIEYQRDSDTGRLHAVYTPSSVANVERVTEYDYDPLTGEMTNAYVGTFTNDIDYADLPTSVSYNYLRGNLTDITRLDGEEKQMGYHFDYDSLDRTVAVNWSGKNDTELLLQNTTYQTGTELVNTVTYGNGDTLRYQYNKAGQTIGIYSGNTQLEGYEYTANSALGYSWYLNEAGAKVGTHYLYDLAGRISATKNTAGHSTDRYQYDLNNNLTSYHSALKDNHTDLEFTTNYAYNTTNAQTALSLTLRNSYSSGTLQYGYDGLGRLNAKHVSLESTSNNLTTTITYKTHNINQNGTDVTLRHLQPSTTHITGTYNNNTVDTKYYTLFAPDGSLSRMRITENNVHNYTHYTYDTLGQLITWKNTGSVASSGATPVSEYNYAYDSGGNITSVVHNESDTAKNYTATYTYDSNMSDLLTSFQKQDANGNPILTKTYSYTAPNDSLFVNPTSIVSTTGNTTETWNLTWDRGRRLSSIQTSAGTINYEYNEDGLRTRRVFADGTKYEYHYNGTQLDYVKVNHSNGNIAHIFRYIYNSEGQAEYIMYIPAEYVNNPNVFSLYYILRDCEGKIHKLIKVREPNATKSATGVQPVLKTAVTYTYDPYGNRLNTTYADKEDYIARFNILLYKDYLYDEETGFYYLQSRYYDPEIGRFINADGFISTGQDITGYNMFAYCGNNPVNRVDPTGQFWKELWDAFTQTIQQASGYFAVAAGVSQVDTPVPGPADVVSGVLLLGGVLVCAGIATYTAITAPAISVPKVEEKSKDIVIPKEPDNPVIFPVDPNTFNPVGLVKVPRAGTKNGAFISWMDPLTNTEVFRWDENPNYSNGPHYHIHGTGHYYPGMIVPEPYATKYFPVG